MKPPVASNANVWNASKPANTCLPMAVTQEVRPFDLQ
jgi:hypothetical protein